MIILFLRLFIGAIALTERPVIGILTLKLGVVPGYGFPASYVKFVELGGGRVVPIMHTWPKDKIMDTLERLDGALFTGGDDETDTYRIAVRIVMDYAKQHEWFPVWGTCLGFEKILTYEGAELFNTNAAGYTTSVDIDFKILSHSKMLGSKNPLTHYVVDLLGTDVTANTHSLGMNRTALAAATEDYLVLGTSLDMSGVEYIAIVEHKSKPIYATQFHPEKIMFEWNQLYDNYLPKTFGAVVANSYFAEFFLNETRKGAGHLTSADEKWVDKHVIYNFNPMYAGSNGESEAYFEQLYIFNSTFILGF